MVKIKIRMNKVTDELRSGYYDGCTYDKVIEDYFNAMYEDLKDTLSVDKFANVHSLSDLRDYLGMNSTEFAHELGYETTRAVRELHMKTSRTRRKYALIISDKWDMDFGKALGLVRKEYDYERDEKND